MSRDTDRETDARNDPANDEQNGLPKFSNWQKRCHPLAKVRTSTQAEQETRARQRLNDTHLSLAAATPKVIRCYVKRGEGISIDASETGTGPHVGENSMSIPAGEMVKRRIITFKKMNFVTCARERLSTPSKLTLQEKMNFSLLEA